VPGRPEIVHTLRLTLADISMGDSPVLTQIVGAIYQNSTFSSAVSGTPDSHFCQRNRILQKQLTILDRDCFYTAGREWMNELAQALPQEMSATARNDEHTRIRQAARLRMCNTLDRVGMLSLDVIRDDTKEQLKQCVVFHDPLHAKTKTFQRMYYVAVCHSCEYQVTNGVRLPVTGSSERASQFIKSQLAQLSDTSNQVIDMLWGQNMEKLWQSREHVFAPVSSNLLMSVAYVTVLSVKLLAAGSRTLSLPQNVALRDLITLVHTVGFRALLALTPKDAKKSEHNNLSSIHNECFSLQQSSSTLGRNDTAQATERSVHDFRASVNARGASDKEAVLTAHVQNAAIVRAETNVRYDPEHTDGGEPVPVSLFLCSCVVCFCKHSRGELVATLKFMSSAARSFIFAQPGRHDILWVSTLELAIQARADPGFEEGPSAKRICFGKTGDSSRPHHFAWDVAGPVVTLWTYTQRPYGIPLDNPGSVLRTLIEMDYLGDSHTLHDDTYAPASDLQAYAWFSTEMLEWWAVHPHLSIPPAVRQMRTAYELEAQRAGLPLLEPPRFDAHPDTMIYVCSRCKTPKVKGARCKVLLCVPAKAKEKAVAIATDMPPATVEDDGAGPALATTASQDFVCSCGHGD